MMRNVTYAKVGGPPDDWCGIQVFDAAGAEVSDVIEVNTAEGWLVRCRRNEAGILYDPIMDEIMTERLDGEFRIVLPEEPSHES